MKDISKMPDMKLVAVTSQVLEFGTYDDKYDFPIKGWDLDEEWVRVFIESKLYEEGENLRVKDFLEIEEQCYSTSRFSDGMDAKDEGYPCYVDFHVKKAYKKGYGKCTNFRVSLERYEDE